MFFIHQVRKLTTIISSKIKYIISTFLLIFIFDQLSKWIILYCMRPGQIIHVLPTLDIVLVFNYGISFGMFQSQGMLGVWFFSAISLILCGWLCTQIKQATKPHEVVSYSMIVGGAIGNVLDRVIHGGVVDFISVHWQKHYWPAFNIADSAIVLGAILILGIELWQSYNQGRKKPKQTTRKKGNRK